MEGAGQTDGRIEAQTDGLTDWQTESVQNLMHNKAWWSKIKQRCKGFA